MDMYGFYSGECFDAYKYLGAHITENKVTFRTFAPNALKIELIGEFNNWNGIEMKRTNDHKFFECTVENAKPGMLYKYKIYNKNESLNKNEIIRIGEKKGAVNQI